MARERNRSGGFTLIECLAALAVTSLVVYSASALLRETEAFFDHGTRAVDETERFAWAVDRLKRDFAGARFVAQAGDKRGAAAFVGQPSRIVFVAAGRDGSAQEEVVEYSAERVDAHEQLVRRRAVWAGPSARLADADSRDPVILLRGAYEISFQFSQSQTDGQLIWLDQWAGAEGLPHSVRVKLIDATSGVDFLAASDFLIRANAPVACASGKEDCLKNGSDTKSAEATPQQQSGTR